MWLAFHAAEAVRVGEVASVPRPMLWRCWLTSVSTCDASEAFGAGQSAARVHVPTAAAAGTDGIGTASAVSASTKTTNRVKVLLIDLGPPGGRPTLHQKHVGFYRGGRDPPVRLGRAQLRAPVGIQLA